MATGSRVLWKGAISFGLVHIPVALHSATSDEGLDFDWLDKRSMDPVGYKRINKKTGREITKENIVKGIEYGGDGKYVVLSEEEIARAYPKSTQTIEIETFVPAAEIPFVYLERPYYIAPINKGQKVYALLRETLKRTGRIGIARVVIQTKQHLAALVPSGKGLVLNLMRWGNGVKTMDNLDLPPESVKSAGLSPKELKMAEQLVNDMSGEWKPGDFTDLFKDRIMDLVKQRAKAGKTETVIQPQEEETSGGAEIIDLTELLQKSLRRGKAANEEGAAKPARKTTRAKPAAKKAAAKAPRRAQAQPHRKAA
jgi:DNA end-binding protein Ku